MTGRLLLWLLVTGSLVSADDLRQRLDHVLSQVSVNLLSSHSQPTEHPPQLDLSFLSTGTSDGLDVAEASVNGSSRWKRSVPQVGPPVGLPEVPHMSVPESEFAHEYVSQTGVGNREELSLTGMTESPVRLVVADGPSVTWRFLRFDSAGYFMSRQRTSLSVWRLPHTLTHGLTFDPSSLVCHIDQRMDGEILGAEFHSVLVYHVPVLRIALLVRRSVGAWTGFLVRTFEVSTTTRTCIPISVFELKGFPRKLSFVSSHYESAVVVLTEGPTHDVVVDFKQGARDSSSSRLIEVSVSGGVDMESFSVGGHSYLVLGHEAGVEIGRLNEFLTHYMHFDLIRVAGVTDVAPFDMGFEHFLAVGTSGAVQFLYEWRDGSFRLKQSLAVSRVLEVTVMEVPTCRDDVLLAFHRSDPLHPLLLFSWSGSRTQFLLAVDDVRKFLPMNYDIRPHSATSFPSNHSAHLLFMDGLFRPHVLSFHTHLVPVPDPVFVQTMRANQMMHNMKQRISAQEEFVQRLLNLISSAVRNMGHNVLPAHEYSFTDLASQSASTLAKIRQLHSLLVQGSPLTMADLQIKIADLRTGIAGLQQSLAGIERNFKHIAFKNLPAVMTGQNKVAAADAAVVNASSTSVDFVAETPVQQLLSSLFLPKHPVPVFARKFFTDIRVAGHVKALINGVNLMNAVTHDRVNRMTSKIALPAVDVRGNFNVQRISGLNLASELIPLNGDRPFEILSPVLFSSMVWMDHLTSPRISHMDVSELFSRSLLTTGDQLVTSPIILNGQPTFGRKVTVRLLNGLALEPLAGDIVRVDRSCVIPGHKIFAAPQFIIRSKFLVNGTLNGLRVPLDLFLTSAPQQVTGATRLAGHQRFTDVAVDRLIDGLTLPQQVVSLTRSDAAPSVRLVQGADIFSSVSANRVDGVDLKLLSHMSVKAGEGRLLNPVFDGPVFLNEALDVTGSSNGLKLSRVAEDVILRNSRVPVLMQGTKTFAAGANTVSALTTRHVNNLDLTVFASTRAPQSIDQLILSAGSSFDRTTGPQPVVTVGQTSINLLELAANHISLTTGGTIASGKNFVSELRIGRNLTSSGLVQGIHVKDLTLRSADQLLMADKTFKNVQMETGLHVLKDASTGIIDGQNLTRLHFMRLTLSTKQILKNMPVSLTSCSADSLVAAAVGDIQPPTFFPTILTQSMDQVVSGSISFTGPVEGVAPVESVRGVNGIKLSQLSAAAVKLHGVSNIWHPLTFESDVTLGLGAQVYGGLVNDMNFDLLFRDVLFKRGKKTQVVSGVTHLQAGSFVNGDVEVDAVNGKHLPTQSLLRFSDQVIAGTVIFNRSLTGARSLRTSSINGMNISDFDRSILQTNRPAVLLGDLILTEDVHVRSDAKVGGRVSGVKLSHLARNSLFKYDNQFITGVKNSVGGVRIMGNLNLITLNNVSFSESLADIVSRYRRSSIPINVYKTFVHPVRAKANLLALTSTTTVSGWVNGVNLDHLLQTAVFMDRPSVLIGVKTFVSDVVIERSGIAITGSLNRVNVLNDVVLRVPHPSGRAQNVSGVKTFYDLRSRGDIRVQGLVNGISLKATAMDSLYTAGDQRITGKKLLSGKLILKDAGIASLNHMTDFRKEVALTASHNRFSGDIVFEKPLRTGADSSVHGLVNGINITDLAIFSLNRDLQQVITGPMAFESIVFLKNVSSKGPIDGVLINNFAREVGSFRQNLRTTESVIQDVMKGQHGKTYAVGELLANSVLEIDHFVQKQVLTGVYGSNFELQGSALVSLAETDRSGINTTSYGLRYKRDAGVFELRQVAHSVPFVKRQFFKLDDTEFSITRVSANNENSLTDIRIGSRVVVKLDPYIDDFEVLVRGSSAYIASFVGVKGHIKVQVLKFFEDRMRFNTISILNVGPSATKMSLFVMQDSLFLAVARSFKGQCAVSDYGSLLFQFREGNNFQLVQRIPVSDSSHVIHYRHQEQDYLMFTDGGDGSLDPKDQSILVFKKKDVSGCQFVLFQKIPLLDIRDISIFSHGPAGRASMYLTAVNESSLMVWRQSGASGFVTSWNMALTGGLAVQPVFVLDSGRLFLLVGQGRKCRGSLVFEAVLRGSTLLPLTFSQSSYS